MTRYVVTALVAGLLLAAAPAPKEDEAKKDVEKLRGTWQVVTVEYKGTADDASPSHVFIFDKDTLTDKSEVVALPTRQVEVWVDKYSFKLDPSKRPPAIDLTLTASDVWPKGRVYHGIYELGEETLKVCWGPEDDRPTEFAAKEGSKHELYTLKKRKPNP
jgi:uncharacterized protein (TIGR03067 family)